VNVLDSLFRALRVHLTVRMIDGPALSLPFSPGAARPAMPHETPLITTLVAGLGLAFIFGAIANRLRLPPIVGYLIAGVVVGPHTPGFVASQELAPELAELGVILLLFGVGLHFSLRDLLSVQGIAIPGAVAQIAVATALGAGLATALGWPIGGGLVFGLALSVASTVVLLRALQERRMLDTQRGRIAVGWLIVEDIAMVLTLVVLPALGGILGGNGAAYDDPLAERLGVESLPGVLAITTLKVAAFIALMLLVGRRVIPWVLQRIAASGSRELFRLGVLTIALGAAFGAAELFGVSLALGAFFAGMILSESELSHDAAQETLPLRDAFSVLFFVAVGMLFNPWSLVTEPLPILATLFIIVIGKSVAAFVIVLAFRHPVATALTISASLAQIGEFSFILAGLGVDLGLLPEQGRDLIVAGALLSIVLNPFAFAAADRMRPLLEKRGLFGRTPSKDRALPAGAAPAGASRTPPADGVARATPADEAPAATQLTDHVVLVGYGRVGSRIGRALKEGGVPFVVVEDADKTVAALREAGIETIVGNAADAAVLARANLPQATHLLVAVPGAFEAGEVVRQGRAASPGLVILARAHSDAELEHLRSLGANDVIMGEREIARGMIEALSRRPPADDGAAA
jgi:CPA2 family monovalent cation:H+ antiporter-2